MAHRRLSIAVRQDGKSNVWAVEPKMQVEVAAEGDGTKKVPRTSPRPPACLSSHLNRLACSRSLYSSEAEPLLPLRSSRRLFPSFRIRIPYNSSAGEGELRGEGVMKSSQAHARALTSFEWSGDHADRRHLAHIFESLVHLRSACILSILLPPRG